MPLEPGKSLRRLLDVPDSVVRSDVPHHPKIWGDICGWYRLLRRILDLRGRMMAAGGVQMFVHGGRLMVRLFTPVPVLYRRFPMHPDDRQDPYVFRLDLSKLGWERPAPC